MSGEQIKPGYKRTEVGLIPEDWLAVDLNTVCTMKSGEGITSERIDAFSAYPCYGGNGLRGYTSRYTHDGRFALVGRQGALCGNVTSVQGKFYASEHAVVVTPKAGIDIDFLTYVLGEMRLNRHTESSAQPGLSVSKILTLRLSVPSTEIEQQTIATALSDVDALLTKLDQLIAKKRDLKQAAIQQLLTGQTRLPGFSGEWEVKRLGEICAMQSGSSITSEGIDEHSPYRCYGGNGLRGFTSSYTHEGSYALIGRQGALCGNVVAAQGRFFASEHAIVVTPFANTDIQWLGIVLRKMNLNQYSESSAQPGLSVVKLLALTASVPPAREQTAIATVLSDMDAELSTLESRRDKTRALKHGMMQELLTGRIRLV